MVPVIRLENPQALLTERRDLLLIPRDRIQPTAAPLIVNACAPHALARYVRIDLDLIPMNPPSRDLDRLSVPLDLFLRFEALATNLHPGIQSRVHFEVVFQDKVAIGFLGAK